MTPNFTVDSAGVSIGMFVEGQGVPVVMVHGSISDHQTFDALVRAAQPWLMTFRMDRRGFGASGDAAGYSIERDYEDVSAVVAEVARRTGTRVALFGHSYGANCALGGAAASAHVSHLCLYEPSLGLQYPQGCIESIEAAIASGHRDQALGTVLSTVLSMTPDEIDTYRRSPTWPDRLRSAHTVPRECRIEQDLSFESTRWNVGCPTLVMVGSGTTDDLASIARKAVAAIEGADLAVLKGLDHLGPKLAPTAVAERLVAFFGSE